MSIEDHLKPIGTLSKKSTLLDGDKIVIYPADFPLAPVGAEFTTIGDLNTSPEEAAEAAMGSAGALHPTQYFLCAPDCTANGYLGRLPKSSSKYLNI